MSDSGPGTPVTKAETREALAELAERRAASKWITAARLRHQLARYADVDGRNVALVSALDTIYLGDDEPYDAYMDAGALLGDAIADLVDLRAAVGRYGRALAVVRAMTSQELRAPGHDPRHTELHQAKVSLDRLALNHAAPAPTREEEGP